MPERAVHAKPSMDNAVPLRWYALTVRVRQEKAVAQSLAHKRLEQFVPLYTETRRWSDRVKRLELPLFPGYVFSRFGLEQKLAVLATPGVRSLVSIGRRPEPVDDEVIDSLRAIVASRFPVSPRSSLTQGERVVVRDGALAGLEGTLAYRAGACEVVVNVDLLARSVAVRINRDAVVPAGQSRGGFREAQLAAAATGIRTPNAK